MNKTYHLLGLMSGTSLDGLDLAHCSFYKENNQWRFEINACQSISYSSSWQNLLEQAINMPAVELLELDIAYGKFLGEAVSQFIKQYPNLPIDAIASHGHTIHHQPEKRLTVQIGAGEEIALRSGHRVICDFRTRDVLLGGQGAPLVPIGDRELFSEYDFCLNLGGIANVSFEQKGHRLAYDLGLANMLFNYLAKKIDIPYDAEGKVAASGQIDNELLQQLNALPYFDLPFPKSTGFEWFAASVLPIIKASPASIPDKMRTGVQHEVHVISKALKKHLNEGTAKAKILVTGGGAKNDFLMQCLKQALGEAFEVHVPEVTLIDFKEAMVFAFMGAKRLAGEVNCLSSVTGAARDSCAGVIYEA